MNLLSLLIFIPLLGAITLFLLPLSTGSKKQWALFLAMANMLLSLVVLMNFDASNSAIQMSTHLPWIASYGIYYAIGINGFSLVIVLLTSTIITLLFIAFFHRMPPGMILHILLAQGGIMGVALAQDLMLFYLFWETMLLPIFFMIGIYGYEKNQFITMKFTIYTIFGSLMMLLGILYLAYWHHQLYASYSFAISDVSNMPLAQSDAQFAFILFFIAFAIKIPLFPFHTWLSQTYRSAPNSVVIILSAIMAKLGVYALWFVSFQIFSKMIAQNSLFFMLLALFGMLYFGLIAMTQHNLKRIFAYSSASHIGLIVAGLFALNSIALSGAIYFTAVHALASTGLFLLVSMLYERLKSYNIFELGALYQHAPRLTLMFSFFALSIVGIPATGGFIAELLLVVGIFKANSIAGIIAATTVLLAMLFVFRFLAYSLFGEPSHTLHYSDITNQEYGVLLFLALCIIAMGTVPQLFLEPINSYCEAYSSVTPLFQASQK